MTLFKTLSRGAGLGLCVVAFAGTAFAGDNGNGNGNGNPPATPPGQEKKAETPAAPAAAAPASAPAPQAAAPGQEKKAEKQQAKSDTKSASKPAAKATAAKAAAPGQAKKAEKQAESPASKSHSQSRGRSAEAHHHVIICHRTGSESNPYVVINIPWTAWTEAHSPDTGSHPDLNGRHDIMLKNPASRPGSKDGFTKSDCVAPAASAPTVQQQTDVCPNIEGMQTTVPTGLVKDAHGNCVQPAPADVCPNIQAMQTTVPAGLVKDAQGNCVTPAAAVATDVCPNVEGMQASVPAGLVRNSEGNCVTPAAAAVSGQASAPVGGVAGAVSLASVGKEKATKAKATKTKAEAAKPAGGVLGAVASAPKAVARTATSGTLPFTGIPLWIAALIGGALLATGLVLRRTATS